MAVYRKYRRTGRSYAHRRRSGYSMYKLYKSRSSGAQARQIYGLNKKLKAIQRRTKPEIKIAPLVQGQVKSTDGQDSNGTRWIPPINLTNLLPEGSTQSGNDVVIDGRFARIQNITLKGLFTYNTAGTADSNADLQRMVSYMRIVIVQTKATRGVGIVSPDVWSSNIVGTDGSVPATALLPFAQLRAPLRPGLARICKVLSDKTYMISDTKQAVNIKTKLKYVRSWYRSFSEEGPKGQVLMFIMMLNQDYADPDNVSSTTFNYVSKCVYSDA
ncbi:capsid protein [Chicken virus mg5_2197]|uniref:Capsid protein n=1 Tax=Chicken virus mg5_2197 TaxID=2720905 RepID=A0A6G9W2A9_9VIRU|nr:capsid protein [Chicken virus mg5_2197]